MRCSCVRKEARGYVPGGLRRVFPVILAVTGLICSISFWGNTATAVSAGETRRFTFYTEPEGAFVSLSPEGAKGGKLLGKTGVPLAIKLSDLCPSEKIVLTFEKRDYDVVKIPLESDYFRSHSRFPEKDSLVMGSSYRKLLIRSNPPGAKVFLAAYSNPRELIFIGTTGTEILINTFGMAEGERYPLELHLKYFKNWQGTLSKGELSPGVVTTIPSRKKCLELVPEWLLLSHLLLWKDRHPFLLIALALSALIGLYYLLSGIIISIRQSSARKKREASWEALANSVNRSDPRFGLRLGNYRIVDKIGKGGMAEVYRAVHESTLSERDCAAIKLIERDLIDEPDFEKRFRREAKISSTLHHPNILHVLDTGEREGLLYIVMEYVRGVTLKRSIPADGMPLATFIALFRQILDAVQFAHHKGVIHRDLKPENIMITENNTVVVMDFGLARHQGASKITASGTAFGTPAYMAPEQVQSGEQDERTDQYSLGVVAYEMITGRVPFHDDITINIMLKHVTEEPPPLHTFRSSLPARIEKMVLKMLEKNPADRYATLNEVRESLEKSSREIMMMDVKN